MAALRLGGLSIVQCSSIVLTRSWWFIGGNDRDLLSALNLLCSVLPGIAWEFFPHRCLPNLPKSSVDLAARSSLLW